MPKNISEVKNPKARKILKYSQKVEPQKLNFKRSFIRGEEALVTLDEVSKAKTYYLLEAKVRKNQKKLRNYPLSESLENTRIKPLTVASNAIRSSHKLPTPSTTPSLFSSPTKQNNTAIAIKAVTTPTIVVL